MKIHAKVAIIVVVEVCIHQKALQSLCSGEKKERARWTKRGMSLILLTCTVIFGNIYSPFYPLSLSWIPIKSSRSDTSAARFEENRKPYYSITIRSMQR